MGTEGICFFGQRGAGGAEALGVKGARLCELAQAKVAVPAGFVISVRAAQRLGWAAVEASIAKLEKATGRRLGDAKKPLVLAVRTSAGVALPGLLPAVLNLGTNEAVLAALGRRLGHFRWAADSYLRLISGYASAVKGVEAAHFEREWQAIAERMGGDPQAWDEAQWHQLIVAFKALYERLVGAAWVDDPQAQVRGAIEAAVDSWNSPVARRARQSREAGAGPSVMVQEMVFGNAEGVSGAGTLFTRDPATGADRLEGEFLPQAQGPDLAGGHQLPVPVKRAGAAMLRLLEKVKQKLERQLGDAQDVAFAVERGKVLVLGARPAKRSAAAAVKIAVEMAGQKLIDRAAALLRVDAGQLEQMLHPTLEVGGDATAIARGLPASPGAAVGKLAFSAAEAEARTRNGEKVILVRRETEPADIGGMEASEGILTSTGGMTSHAAVVARGMGRACVVGAQLEVRERERVVMVGQRKLTGQDWISIDGGSGQVYGGALRLREAKVTGQLRTLLAWADEYRRMDVRANADTPRDAVRARQLGARGIGLCRTEHMFFAADRIVAMRQMILARDVPGRQEALAKLLPYQRGDFVAIFKAMKGLPVTIRLLDPPLHEFLPLTPEAQESAAAELGLRAEQVAARVGQLHEMNPMLGHRGCRLCITYPEIAVMQVRAIMEAACWCAKRKIAVNPEILVPLVSSAGELKQLVPLIRRTADEVMEEQGVQVGYAVGTMVETPRAALTAAELAREVEFFSFGTNDLTQTTLGLSRDDGGGFIPQYVASGIWTLDPFTSLDESGVGRLVQMAVRDGRAAQAGLKCGVCGEQGGEPRSIRFFERSGMDYVSCSPFRVPIARLAAAQAALGRR